LKRTSTLRRQLPARCPTAFRPRIEELEHRNAPGEVLGLGLGALSLWGPDLSLLLDSPAALERPDTELTSATSNRLGLAGMDGFQLDPSSESPHVRASTSAVTVVTSSPSTSSSADSAREAEVHALNNTGDFTSSGMEEELARSQSGRGGFERQWSEQLEARFQQSMAGLNAEFARGGTAFASVAQPANVAQPDGHDVGQPAFFQMFAGQMGRANSVRGAGGLNVTIVGDTNRDGVIDANDLDGRDSWTRDSGAIYMVNFAGDGNDGQPNAVNWNDQGRPFNENKTIKNTAYASELAPVVIGALGPGFDPNAMQVFLKTADLEQAEAIHVYPGFDPGTQAVLGGIGDRALCGSTSCPPEPTEADITAWVSPTANTTFGVEGLLFRNVGAGVPAYQQFNGYVDLSLEVRQDGQVLGSDTMRMKVAPWILPTHEAPSLQAYAGNYGTINRSYLFSQYADPGYVGLDDSGQLTAVGSGQGTQWFKDHGEFGWTSFPGGPVEQVFFRLPYYRGGFTPQPPWPQQLILRPGVGTFQLGINLGAGSGDYGGNLGTIHATASNPLGEIVMGNIRSQRLFSFLQSQEVQTPFTVPTSWLDVGHIDETFGFTQNHNQVVVADPTLAYKLMNAIPEADQGKTVFFATGQDPISGTATVAGTSTIIYTGIDHTKGYQGWKWIRIYDSSASGSNATGQMARIAPGGLQNGYVVVNRVYNTTSNVIGSGNSHMRWMLQSNPPNQATWYSIPQAGDKFVLIDDTQQWYNTGTNNPAALTVAEVLRDTAFRDLNLIDVQGALDTIKATLDMQAGGPGTLTFVPVPTLYVGRRAGFATGRSALAYTPGLANVMPIGNSLYFPRQFGIRDSQGQDIFETVTHNALPTAQFVDDWNLYHRLEGEVHCGVVVNRDAGDGQWWNYQP
jgi:hypothetical protein